MSSKKKINLTATQLYLLQNITTKIQYNNCVVISALIKNYPITITGCGPINEAISTVGGISLHEVTSTLALKKLPNHYAILFDACAIQLIQYPHFLKLSYQV